jgi:hypothetical protein
MSEFTIDKDIPLPAGTARSKYQFHDIKVGYSLGFKSVVEARRCMVSATAYGKRHNMKFRQAKCRVWRIE